MSHFRGPSHSAETPRESQSCNVQVIWTFDVMLMLLTPSPNKLAVTFVSDHSSLDQLVTIAAWTLGIHSLSATKMARRVQ
ncbi:hypothetical protein EJ05DRAFT_480484 [Pseudovirgaria hyperparasitica]|uniref:Uncharacterized protein n=1 Tax=Pseudovirgaria hyperparasitica TaxID=470096 RepID=A0A6A6VV31_9PEZI|nr:uncharacterized protein EJ05DRAFT_480484 [Pseudovirgaria hyperparasitica]KAF2753480.1 hypothetical protein EJ05DRAFT_480484 [Pseudovirgaria hyperparasitica]